MSIGTRAVRLALFIALWSAIASAQTVTVVRNVDLRPEQTSSEPAIRLLTPSDTANSALRNRRPSTCEGKGS